MIMNGNIIKTETEEEIKKTKKRLKKLKEESERLPLLF